MTGYLIREPMQNRPKTKNIWDFTGEKNSKYNAIQSEREKCTHPFDKKSYFCSFSIYSFPWEKCQIQCNAQSNKHTIEQCLLSFHNVFFESYITEVNYQNINTGKNFSSQDLINDKWFCPWQGGPEKHKTGKERRRRLAKRDNSPQKVFERLVKVGWKYPCRVD